MALDVDAQVGRHFVADGAPREIECSVAISHQQLKDLIVCPEKRGEFYYIGGKSLYRAESGGEGSSYTYEHTRLDYVPNCIGVGFEHLALAGPKSELTLLPLRRLAHLSSPAIHTRLPYPASINNSLFVSHSSHLALPLAPATGTPRPPWGGSDGIRVGVSNNDGSVRVMGVERNETPRANGDFVEELRLRKKKVLNMVGEVEIPVSVNHSSISPDGRTLLSVGDSSKVYLHQVSNSGEAFRPIAVYTASQDAGFSTAWSGDGRRFAVASQDGKISVWDHRSSVKLATLSTTPLSATTLREISEPSMTRGGSLLASQYSFLSSGGTGGRFANAARVVKFSPASSTAGRTAEVLAFTDEFTSLYLCSGLSPSDAEKDVLPLRLSALPLDQRADAAPTATVGGQNGAPVGTQKMSIGTTGCGFSPCGGWVWGGTEGGIREWQVRSYRGGGEQRCGFL